VGSGLVLKLATTEGWVELLTVDRVRARRLVAVDLDLSYPEPYHRMRAFV
jgi:hypothetical protein